MDTNFLTIDPNECVTRYKRDELADNLEKLSRKLAYYESLEQRREIASKYNANWEAFKCVASCVLLVFFANFLIILSSLVPEDIYSILANASLVIGAIYCIFGVISCYSVIDKHSCVSNTSNRILNSKRCYTLYNSIHSFFDEGFATSDNAMLYAKFIREGKSSSINEAKEHLRYLNRQNQYNEMNTQENLSLCRN